MNIALNSDDEFKLKPSSQKLICSKHTYDFEKEAFVIGNSRLGASFLGGANWDQIVLNEESIWGGLHSYDNLSAGLDDFQSDHSQTGFGAFLPAGSLGIDFDLPGSSDEIEVHEFRRELDLAKAVHRVEAVISQSKASSLQASEAQSASEDTELKASAPVTISREAFASYPLGAIVLRIKASAKINAHFSFSTEHDGAFFPIEPALGHAIPRLVWCSKLENNLHFELRASVIETDAKITDLGPVGPSDHKLVAADFTELVLLISITTSYDPISARPAPEVIGPEIWQFTEAATKMENRALELGYEALLKEHLADVAKELGGVSLNLESGGAAFMKEVLPTAERLERYQHSPDLALEELLFNYGRYLLFSSSRPGSLPANLQGVWNDSYEPAWGSDYHSNINLQMNYWPAEITGLGKLQLPLFDFLKRMLPHYRKHTQAAFGQVRGWTTRTSQSPFGGEAWQWNTVASAWYALHLVEHWRHLGTVSANTFALDTAWPFVSEVCDFWEDTLVEGSRRVQTSLGAMPELLSPNGWSPEHGPREDGVTYDQQILRDLFQAAGELAKVAGDESAQARYSLILERLGRDSVGSWGQLMEWREDLDDPNDLHRHTSHLFGIYPGASSFNTDSEQQAKIKAAALVSLSARCAVGPAAKAAGELVKAHKVAGDSVRSWTWPWRAALFARLGDAEAAYEMLKGLLRYSTLPNLWATHPPFQIDGNFGITAAMAEMLLQSHLGVIELLPALPAAWEKGGSFKGFIARGGFKVSCAWRAGEVSELLIEALEEGPKQVKVRFQGADYLVEVGTKLSEPFKQNPKLKA